MNKGFQSIRNFATGVASDGGTPDNPGQKRHRILKELQHELERHPAVQHVRGFPNGKYRKLRAKLDPNVLGSTADNATFQISWWPEPGNPEFVFHYSDDTGFDCGWHREPNPHVDGQLHYQERASATEAYEYEPVTISGKTPTRILWTILDRLPERVR